MKSSIFENLFVLELANNHWGNIHRGMKIIKDFAEIIKKQYKSSYKISIQRCR